MMGRHTPDSKPRKISRAEMKKSHRRAESSGAKAYAYLKKIGGKRHPGIDYSHPTFRHTPGNPSPAHKAKRLASKQFTYGERIGKSARTPAHDLFSGYDPHKQGVALRHGGQRGGVLGQQAFHKGYAHGFRHTPGNPPMVGMGPHPVTPGRGVMVGPKKTHGVYMGPHPQSKGMHRVMVGGKESTYTGSQVHYRHTPGNPGLLGSVIESHQAGKYGLGSMKKKSTFRHTPGNCGDMSGFKHYRKTGRLGV